MENNVVFGVHMETQEKIQIIMLVENIIVCPIIQKVLLKIQNDQN